IAVLVSRLAASGGPRLPGSRAKTNKVASDTSRDFRAGAMLILTVTSAALEAPVEALVPAGDALVSAGGAPLPGEAVSAAPLAAGLPDGGPSSAMRASSIWTICGGGFNALSACQRVRASARSPRTAAAKPAYRRAFGLPGAKAK